MSERKLKIMGITTTIVKTYVKHNEIAPDALPGLIGAVFNQVSHHLEPHDSKNVVKPIPAVSIAESVTDDYIICLEDGLKYKSLKRHLRTQYQMTPKAYREKWGLSADYPMVAKNYSKERSRLAKRTGLGKS